MAKKSIAKTLKDKGLIPKDWDLRKPLTRGQKSYVTKQANAFKELVRAPEKFTVRRVSKATSDLLKGSGYKSAGDRVIVPNRGGTVHIRGARVDYDLPDRRETVLITAGSDFLDRLELLAAREDEEGEDDSGAYQYGIRIGDASSSALNFPSLNDLLAYLPRMKLHSANAVNHMVLVRIEYKQDFMRHRGRD